MGMDASYSVTAIITLTLLQQGCLAQNNAKQEKGAAIAVAPYQ
ncbi:MULTISPECIES: hypothetical protein [Chromobacterium]|nr:MULTISPECIES: hypothetical protein [Chromobacterium]